MAGIILVLLALLRAGRAMSYVPVPVVEGFTLGIAAVIGLQQIPGALGVRAPSGNNPAVVAAEAAGNFATHPHWISVTVALAVAAVMLVGARLRPGSTSAPAPPRAWPPWSAPRCWRSSCSPPRRWSRTSRGPRWPGC